MARTPRSRPHCAGPSATPTPCSARTRRGPPSAWAAPTSSPRSCVSHLLVTNDFPPKVGGIQSYLWELWRRLPPERVRVLTTPHAGAAAFDAQQAFPVERVRAPVLLPFDPAIRRAVRRHRPDLVVL